MDNDATPWKGAASCDWKQGVSSDFVVEGARGAFGATPDSDEEPFVYETVSNGGGSRSVVK